MNILTLGARVGANTSEFHSKMAGVRSDADATKASLTGISTATVGVGSALGNLAANAISSVLSGLSNLGAHAVQVVGDNERMQMSFEALMAREIRNNSAVEKRILLGQKWVTVGGQAAEATGKNAAAMERLETVQANLPGLQNRIAKAERLVQTATQKKNEAYEDFVIRVDGYKASILRMQEQLGDYNKVLGTATPAAAGKAGEATRKLVNVYKTETEYTISKKDAYAKAAVEAKNLMKWVERLAIESPFNKADVAEGFKAAMAYGMTSKQAKVATQATVDFAAATGQSSEAVGGLLFAMGQINNSDKLMAQDLRQLMNRGVDVNSILKQMGTSFSKVGKSSVDSRKFLELMIKTMQDDFGGAAKAQANTISGLIASLQDLGDIATEDIFKPVLMSAKPAIESIVGALSDPEVKAALGAFGGAMGSLIAGPLNGLAGLITGGAGAIKVFMTNLRDVGPVTAMREALKTMLPPWMAPTVDRIAKGVNMMRWAFIGAKDPAKAFGLGLEDIFGKDIATQVQPMVDWVFQLPDKLRTALQQLKSGDLKGALVTWWQTTFGGSLEWGAIISKWVASLAEQLRTGGWIASAGKTIGGWLESGIEAIDLTVTSEQFRDPLLRMSKSLGEAAGNSAGAVAEALKSWGYALLGWPEQVGDKDLDSSAARFVRKLGKSLGNVREVMTEVGASFMSSFIGTLFNFDDAAIVDAQAKIKALYKRIFTPFAMTPEDTKAEAALGAQADGMGAGFFENLNKQMVTGLENMWKNIKLDATELVTAIKNNIQEVATALGISSPSTWVMSVLGTPLGQAIPAGILGEMANVKAAFLSLIQGGVPKGDELKVEVPIRITPKMAGEAAASGANPYTSGGGGGRMFSVATIASAWGLTAAADGSYALPTPITLSVSILISPTSLAQASTMGPSNPGYDLGYRVGIAAAAGASSSYKVFTTAMSTIVSNGTLLAKTELGLAGEGGGSGSAPYALGLAAGKAVGEGVTPGLDSVRKALMLLDAQFTQTEKNLQAGFAMSISAVGIHLKSTVTENFNSFTNGALAALNSALSTTRGLLQSILTMQGQVRPPPTGTSGASSSFTPPPSSFTTTSTLDNFNNQQRERNTTVVHLNIGSRHAGSFVKEMVSDEVAFDSSRYYN